MIEQKAINDVCKLFGTKYANVQPHSGSSANQAVYRALLEKGDTVLGMDLGAGGHLTHGHKMSFSGQDYNIISYGVDENGIIDFEDLEKKLYKYQPKMLIVGASSYSQIIPYSVISDIVEKYKLETMNEIYTMCDMAHVAGLVAANEHPNPCSWFNVVTSTTHKTLRGPRGGIILWNDESLCKRINSAVFPGIQGGPLEHIIAAKGICFEEAMTPEFKAYGKQVVKNSFAFAEKFKSLGYKVISNGTENHMFVLDVYHTLGITGKQAEEGLDKIHVTVNKNQIPNDTLPPLKSSGLRIGTPAMTTKGFIEEDFEDLAMCIDNYLRCIKEDVIDENINDIHITRVMQIINRAKNRSKE